ncbi:type II secretion system F family protein [Luteipulveratus mongoliensis]|uniref:type II secretion system F family protein n=1 Tax=Luteipulveratus mongoliensis TaxID=571913 RepID=UPI000696E002|nr:type II secretion system F family protein [Luteipulveratus mongoliensis]
MVTLILAAAALGAAVLVWPPSLRARALGLGTEPAGPASDHRPRRRRRTTRAARERAQAVLQLLEGIVPAVQVGVPPAQAVAVAVESAQIREPGLRADLEALARAGRDGHELGPAWTELADRHELTALAEVGRAWTLSDRLGTPLAEALTSATSSLRARLEHERRVRVLTAGPRATMQLLTLLPLGGAGLAPLIGVSPAQVYTGPVVLLAGVPGVILLLLGRAMVARMVRRATAERSIA